MTNTNLPTDYRYTWGDSVRVVDGAPSTTDQVPTQKSSASERSKRNDKPNRQAMPSELGNT